MQKTKSKIDIIKWAFWALIIFSIASIISIFINYPQVLEVKNMLGSMKPITINFSLKTKPNPSKIFLCFNSFCTNPDSDFFNNIYSYKFNKYNKVFFESKVKSIYLAYPKEAKGFEKNIDFIDIHIGTDNYYYKNSDILKFEKKNFSLDLDDNDNNLELSAISIPNPDNYMGILEHISAAILSIFTNWNLFIIPYFWLIVAGLIYIFNREKFDFKLNLKTEYWILGGIILLAFFLRVVNITYYPLWLDEVYTKTVALSSFASTFQDPGNPPLFFILEFLFTKIFSTSTLSLRILPMLFGVGVIPLIYLIFKDSSKKFALFTAFLASINTIFIYHSQEARGYSMCAFLIVLSIYVLFNYLKNPSTKKLIAYLIVLIAMVNANYYLILLAFCNFIWAIVDLIENNNKNEILKFIGIHFIAGLSVLPFLIISAKAALAFGFNGWIPPLDRHVFLSAIKEYFVSKEIFLIFASIVLINLVICFIPKIKKNKELENLFIYLIYSAILIVILASLISVFIKPIFHKRVLLSIYMLGFLIEAITLRSVIEFKKFNKFLYSVRFLYFIAVLGLCLYITKPMPVRKVCNFSDFMNLIKNDAPKYHIEGYEIHALIPDYEEYLKEYPEVKELKYIKWHKIIANNGAYIDTLRRKDYTDKKNKVIIYSSSSGVMDFKNMDFNPRMHVFHSNITPSVKAIYD